MFACGTLKRLRINSQTTDRGESPVDAHSLGSVSFLSPSLCASFDNLLSLHFGMRLRGEMPLHWCTWAPLESALHDLSRSPLWKPFRGGARHPRAHSSMGACLAATLVARVMPSGGLILRASPGGACQGGEAVVDTVPPAAKMLDCLPLAPVWRSIW